MGVFQELPPELRYVYGGDPIKLGPNQGLEILTQPIVTMSKYPDLSL